MEDAFQRWNMLVIGTSRGSGCSKWYHWFLQGERQWVSVALYDRDCVSVTKWLKTCLAAWMPGLCLIHAMAQPYAFPSF